MVHSRFRSRFRTRQAARWLRLVRANEAIVRRWMVRHGGGDNDDDNNNDNGDNNMPPPDDNNDDGNDDDIDDGVARALEMSGE